MADSKELKKLEKKIKELEDTIIKLKKGFNEAINELGIGNFSKQFIDKYLTTPDEIKANTISANEIKATTIDAMDGEVWADLYGCLSKVVPMREAHENGDDFNGEKELVALMEYSEDCDYNDFHDTNDDSWDERTLSFFGGLFKIIIKDNYSYSGESRRVTRELKLCFRDEEYVAFEEYMIDGELERRKIYFFQDTNGL